MNTIRVLFPMSLLVAIATPGDRAMAQTDSALAHAASSHGVSSHGVSSYGGVLRGDGPGYKVVFDRGGFEFTPALGRHADRNRSLRFCYESVRRGTRRIDRAAFHPAPRRAGDFVAYRRGAGIVERYEVRADGIEQTFTFDRRPAGSGDLVVRGRLDTGGLPLDTAVQTDGLHFFASGVGGVRVGGVTGIDAAGRRVRGGLRFDGAWLELSLPGEFVDRAVYPLVLDPLIGSSTPLGSGDTSAADVAYDAATDTYLVVWQREFSAVQIEVFGQRVAGSGSLIGGSVPIAPGPIAMEPTVAAAGGTGSFLVAWQLGVSIFGPWDVQARRLESTSAALSTVVTVAASAANETGPDLGGAIGDSGAVIVWNENGAGIRAAPMLATDPPTVGVVATLSTDPRDRVPAVSRLGNDGRLHDYRWLCVWQRRVGRNAIRGRFVESALEPRVQFHPLAPEFAITSGIGATQPDVDGMDGSFLVVYEQRENATDRERDIRCKRVAIDLGTRTVTVGAPSVVAGTAAKDEAFPAVGMTDRKWFVAWSEERVRGGTEYDVRMQAIVAADDCRPCGARLHVRGISGGYHHRPEIASTRGRPGMFEGRGMVVFNAASNTPPFESEVRAQRFVEFGSGTVESLGGACGNGGVVDQHGPFVVGNADFAFWLRGAGPASVTVLSLGLPDAGTIPCGTCTFMLPLDSFPANRSRAPFPLPCDPGLSGAALQVQWISLGAATSECPLVADLSMSTRVRFTVGD